MTCHPSSRVEHGRRAWVSTRLGEAQELQISLDAALMLAGMASDVPQPYHRVAAPPAC